jgi:Family of unknown function (DUF6328)
MTVEAAGPAAAKPWERHETEAERIDRNLIELLQELRVASIGVQVLFGFLLSLPFTDRFGMLSAAQRRLYLGDLLLTALAAALLSAPVAYHRLVFHQHKKRGLVRAANALAISGLTAVAFAISGAVFLAVSIVYSGIVVPIVAAGTAATFVVLWFVIPWFDRRDRY